VARLCDRDDTTEEVYVEAEVEEWEVEAVRQEAADRSNNSRSAEYSDSGVCIAPDAVYSQRTHAYPYEGVSEGETSAALLAQLYGETGELHNNSAHSSSAHTSHTARTQSDSSTSRGVYQPDGREYNYAELSRRLMKQTAHCKPVFVSPSSDHNVKTLFFGGQRVVVPR
jgi:hypothetical protein